MLINLNDIDDDTHFKISKNIFSQDLEHSIRLSGMIEVPSLIERDKRYIPLTCHNRIKILKTMGAESVYARVIPEPDCNIFMNNIAIKMYKNEIGPAGRLRALHILKNDFNIGDSALEDFSKKILKIPADISGDSLCIASINNIPQPLSDYIDTKDVAYKIIKDIAAFKAETVSELNRWTGKIQIRLNIFKMLVDHVFDIVRRDGELTPIDDGFLDNMDDKKLYDYIFRIRYPEYTRKREMSDMIINGLTGRGVSIDFPEYYERGDFTLKINISKRYNRDKIIKVISEIDIKRIEELISFL